MPERGSLGSMVEAFGIYGCYLNTHCLVFVCWVVDILTFSRRSLRSEGRSVEGLQAGSFVDWEKRLHRGFVVKCRLGREEAGQQNAKQINRKKTEQLRLCE